MTSDDLRNRVARAIAYSGDVPEKREWSKLLPETRSHYWKLADAAISEMGGVRVKPLVWEYHPAGTIAAPPTGHAYIIDTRMKGRVHSIKGFNPQREFASMDEAKAAADGDHRARILAALEPAPDAQAALDRIERKAEMLRLEAKQRNRPNMVQHMEEIAHLVKMVRRNSEISDDQD